MRLRGKESIVFFHLALGFLLSVSPSSAAAGPRDGGWVAVAEAIAKRQPQTALAALRPVEAAAFAARAWPEGTRALLLRVRLENGLWFDEDPLPEFAPAGDREPEEPLDPFAAPFVQALFGPGGPVGCAIQLEREIPLAPEPARPLLRWFQARWLAEFHESQRFRWHRDDPVAPPPADDDFDEIATWGSERVTAAIARAWRLALEPEAALKASPAESWSAILSPGTLGDALRPTLFDILAHDMLLALEFGRFRPDRDPFHPSAADSPVFADAESFLAWNPPAPAGESPNHRALLLYQKLLAFHHADADRSAFLHCDLERLRWAGRVARGRGKDANHMSAIHAFIASHTGHPLSADARLDGAILNLRRGDARQAHAVALAGADTFPDHPFGRVCRVMASEIARPALDLSTPATWPPDGEWLFVSSKNLGMIRLRLYPDTTEPGGQSDWHDPDGMTEDDLAKILATRPLRSWQVAVDAPRDFKQRESVIDTPRDLPAGGYLLVVSGSEGFRISPDTMRWARIEVSEIAISAMARNDQPGLIRGTVTDARSGAPLAGVAVECRLTPADREERSIKMASAEDGSFVLDVPAAWFDRRLVVIARRDGHRAAIRTSVRPPGSNTDPPRQVSQVGFFTDRSIYRPGQEILFKGVLCEADTGAGSHSTAADRKVGVSLIGPGDREIATREFTTNAFGSFSGSFTAPAKALLGAYTLRAGEIGSGSLRVEEYKRPGIEVALTGPTRPAQIGETVEINGRARDFTGAPVDDAEVEWELWRSPYFIGRDAWRYPELTFEMSGIARGTTRTSADGGFVISFGAEPDHTLEDAVPGGLAFAFDVECTVAARSGESESDWISVSVGPADLDAEIHVNEWSAAGEPVAIRISTTTLDLDPHPAEGLLRVHRLREPEECPTDDGPRFWHVDSFDSPPEGTGAWETGETVHEVPVKSTAEREDGACVAHATVDLGAGRYRAIFEGRDTRGRRFEAITDFQVVDPTADRFSTMMPFFTLVREPVREPGEPVTLLWGSGLAEARACVEWFKDRTLLRREWSAPGRTQQLFHFTPDESMRGGISVAISQFGGNRWFRNSEAIRIPWSNKELKLRWERITDKLEPGARETWTAVVEATDGQTAAAEMVATLYDASLDIHSPHSFETFSRSTLFRRDSSFAFSFHYAAASLSVARSHSPRFDPGADDSPEDFDDPEEIQRPFRGPPPALGNHGGVRLLRVNPYGRSAGLVGGAMITLLDRNVIDFYEPPELPNQVGFPVTPATPLAGRREPGGDQPAARAEREAPMVRRKLGETAFFKPHLVSDPAGRVRIPFTMPEGLGRWRFLGFAHDPAMRSGILEGETITARELMVRPNPPRFLREGDAIGFPVRIVNQSDREREGTARLTLTAADGVADLTGRALAVPSDQPFRIPPGESRTLVWPLEAPEGDGPLRYKIVATSGTVTDGEEGWLPVLPRRIAVTDSLAVEIRDAGQKQLVFTPLHASGKSDTLRHGGLQVRVVSRPAWQALLALPWLMDFPHDCAEQTFHRYYAAALGRHLLASHPRMREVLDSWRDTAALNSPLERNREVTGLLLEETPWLRHAADESQRRRHLARVFTDADTAGQIEGLAAQIEGLQGRDGLWPWFAGGDGSETTTLTIITGIARLRAIGAEVDTAPALRAIAALDDLMLERFERIRDAADRDPAARDHNHLTPWIARYLFARSFFLADLEPADRQRAAREFFLDQARRHWPRLDSRMAAAHVALALHREGDTATARLITRSLRERAIRHPEDGMFWRDSFDDGWWWWQAPIETQLLMIEAFTGIDADPQAADDCRTWLIRQQRGEAWPTTTATADAVYAILGGLAADADADAGPLPEITLGGVPVEPRDAEAGTGYYEHRFQPQDITPALATISFSKRDPGIAWAGVHWQYFEDITKLRPGETRDLKVAKSLFVRRGGRLEPLDGPVRVGEEVVSRLVLTNGRPMEFVQIKDPRGAGLEPSRVLSGHRWSEGVTFYEETRDSAAHFFIESLPAGTRIFESSARVQHAGRYLCGPAEARCMYAPEFHARSESITLESTAHTP